ncbi:hypothetical protein SUDANB43_03136 [Streptomyces sp. enrichment culture]
MRRGRMPGWCGGAWWASGAFPARTRSRMPPAARGVRSSSSPSSPSSRSARGRSAARGAARGRGRGRRQGQGPPCRRRSAKWEARGPPWGVGRPTAGPRDPPTWRRVRSADAHRPSRIPRRARIPGRARVGVWLARPVCCRVPGCFGQARARVWGRCSLRAPRAGWVCRTRAYRRCGPWLRVRCCRRCCVWLAGPVCCRVPGCFGPVWARVWARCWFRAPRAGWVCWAWVYWRCGPWVWVRCCRRSCVWLAGPVCCRVPGCFGPVWARVWARCWFRAPRAGPACRTRAYRHRGPEAWVRRCRARVWRAAPA